jgi:hypothetical protein
MFSHRLTVAAVLLGVGTTLLADTAAGRAGDSNAPAPQQDPQVLVLPTIQLRKDTAPKTTEQNPQKGTPATVRLQSDSPDQSVPQRDPQVNDQLRQIQEQARQIEEQARQIDELRRRLDALGGTPAAKRVAATADDKAGADPADSKDGKDGKDSKAGSTLGAPDPDAVKKVVADYLKQNPGAGMPPSVQTGFFTGQGFVIRSAPNPDYVQWDDESRIPFELRLRGRVQVNYYGYKVTDDSNHATGAHQQAADANAHRFADFSQLEVKRLRLVFEGTAFDPDLRYHFEIDGNTRGLGAVQNNKDIQTAGAFDPNATAASSIGGGAVVDHAVRLFSAYVAYDFHGCASQKGCGFDCPDGTYKYAPTYTLIAGKMKPAIAAEEWMSGSANEQFVEYSMADWYFDADDDNLMVAAGTQIKALDDRFYLQALITNGNESQFPNTQMDEWPGFNLGMWYDFGGTWNEQRHRWDLWGDSFSDIDYSCRPILRIGGAANIVPMDRRSLYGDDEQSRVFVMPAGPGGTRLINLLNGDGPAAATTFRGAHAVDKFDSYTYEAFIGAKYRGFSISDEWWVRDLNGFKAAPDGNDLILYTYTDPRPKVGTITALFPEKALIDYGMQLQCGYFVVPKKLELVARWSYISGESGDILGNGQTSSFRIPNGIVGGTTKSGLERVQINQGAFTNFHQASEYTIGVNYYWHRQLLKWQTDCGLYQGGNPAGGGVSPAGFIAGSDGWLVRTQVQLAF